MKIIFTMANNSSVPYFNWFAEESLKDNLHEFIFISLHKELPVMLDEMQNRNLKCYWVQFNDEKRKRSMVKSFFKLLYIFLKEKPDVVHTHLFDDSLPGQLAALITGVKKRVVTKQDTTYHWKYKPQFVKFDKLINKLSTHIHSVASSNYRFILDIEKANPNKVYLIRNGFPLNTLTKTNPIFINKFREKFDLHNKIVIGTVARLIEWKGHKLIIEAAAELIKTHKNLMFVWAGTGSSEYRKELNHLVNLKNLEKNIIFLDWVDRSDMPSLYRCMDIYLHPAIGEPFGFAISEAFANKTPVISTITGSTDLTKNNSEAIIIEENSSNQIILALKKLIEDPDLRNDLSENGFNYFQNHLTFSRMYQEHLTMYNK